MTRPDNNLPANASTLAPDDLRALFDVSDHGLEDYAKTIGPDYDGTKEAILTHARAPSAQTRREACLMLDALLDVHATDVSDERSLGSILERARTAGRAERAAIVEALKDLLAPGAPPLPLSDAPLLKPQWLIDDWMPLGDVGALAIDDSGAEAAALPLQIAHAVATASSAFATADSAYLASPKTTRQAMLVGWRDRLPTMATRLHAIRHHFERTERDGAMDRIIYKDALGAGRLWETTRGKPRLRSGLSTLGREIREHAETLGVALLIVDPLQMALEHSDDSRAEIDTFIDDWRAWATGVKITTLFVARPRSDLAWRDLSGFSWHLKPCPGSDQRMTLQLEHSQAFALDSVSTSLQLVAKTTRDPRTGRRQRVLQTVTTDPTNDDDPSETIRHQVTPTCAVPRH